MTVQYPVSRSMTEKVPIEMRYTYVNGGNYPNNCFLPVSDVRQGTLVKSRTVYLGASPPGWKSLILQGVSATSMLSATGHAIGGAFAGNGNGTYEYDFAQGESCVRGYAEGQLGAFDNAYPSSASSVISFEADYKARERLLEKYLDIRKKWRGGNFIAEFAETVHMFKHPVTSIFGETVKFARSMRELEKRSFRNQRRGLKKAASGLWLSWAFGVKPLFDDISDASKALDNLNAGGVGRGEIPISGSATIKELVYLLPAQLTSGQSPLNGYTSCDKRQETSAKVRYHGRLKARPESFATIADNFGIALGDLPAAVWEATPWSFLVDYFINVQAIIDSWQYAQADFGWLIRGVKNTTTNTNTAWYQTRFDRGLRLRVSVPQSALGAHFKERVSLPTFPYPMFRFKIPNIESKKWINVAALVDAIGASRLGVPIMPKGSTRRPRSG